jgi:26S proteasome regulatory subunit N10
MPLEATMILVDNSDWSRNGDFFPTRWEAQEEAANIVSQAKCEQNAESSVGLMVIAGKQVEILVTPVQDPGRILASFPGVKLGGRVQLSTALQIAQLALKHRLNKNQKQRIIVFVASPVEETEDTLVKLGQRLRKNAIAIDVINLESSNPDQNAKLQKLVDATKDAADNSHYVQVSPGIQLLSDTLLSTPVLMSGEGGQAGAGLGDFGAGAGMDPELEMALRISLEEEKAREQKKKDDDDKKTKDPGQPKSQDDNKMKIEEPSKPANLDDMDEEELLLRAQELSLQDAPAPSSQSKGKDDKTKEQEAFQDPEFINELLSGIPGLDKDDPELKKMTQKKDDKGEGKDDKK